MRYRKIVAAATASLVLTLTACQQIGRVEVLPPQTSAPVVEDEITTTPPVVTDPIDIPVIDTPPVELNNVMPQAPEGLSEEELELFENASQIVSVMTIEQKVGQLFCLTASSGVSADDAQGYMLGGVYYDADFFKTTTKSAVSELNENMSQKDDILLFTYEQGGVVAPITSNSHFRAFPFWGIGDLYNDSGMDLVESDIRERTVLLKGLGLNGNYGINAAICSSDDSMYASTLRQPAQTTANIVKTAIESYEDNGICTVVGAFPYGADSIEDVNADNSVMSGYVSAIENGADFIMMYQGVIAEEFAYLNPQVHTALEDMGYYGATIIDLSEESTYLAVTEALTAGNDMFIVSDKELVTETVLKVRSGELDLALVNDAVVSIMMSKISANIMG